MNTISHFQDIFICYFCALFVNMLSIISVVRKTDISYEGELSVQHFTFLRGIIVL